MQEKQNDNFPHYQERVLLATLQKNEISHL